MAQARIGNAMSPIDIAAWLLTIIAVLLLAARLISWLKKGSS